MKLAGKTAIVTGAGSGIGRAIAVLFAKEGAKVVLTDIDQQSLNDTTAQIKAEGGQAIAVAV
ncbi:MAG: SDR family NAD(P)-dependent oxidoreductase, partial [Firmicutes bacterium]|nr:SDR family NAD(P)-dependent oxidoreductase [Bacillota bacterium]